MKASELIRQLQRIIRQFGDLPIVGGYIHDDTPPRRVTVLDGDGCETNDASKAKELFLER